MRIAVLVALGTIAWTTHAGAIEGRLLAEKLSIEAPAPEAEPPSRARMYTFESLAGLGGMVAALYTFWFGFAGTLFTAVMYDATLGDWTGRYLDPDVAFGIAAPLFGAAVLLTMPVYTGMSINSVSRRYGKQPGFWRSMGWGYLTYAACLVAAVVAFSAEQEGLGVAALALAGPAVVATQVWANSGLPVARF